MKSYSFRTCRNGEGELMPLYEYRCSSCGCVEERFQHARGVVEVLSACCGAPSPRVPSASFVGGAAIKRYASKIDDRVKENAAKGAKSRDGINQGASPKHS